MHKTNIKCNRISKRIVRTAYQTINVYQNLTQLNRKHKRVKERSKPMPDWNIDLNYKIMGYATQVPFLNASWIGIQILDCDKDLDSGWRCGFWIGGGLGISNQHFGFGCRTQSNSICTQMQNWDAHPGSACQSTSKSKCRVELQNPAWNLNLKRTFRT